jgi:hypothetical protein
MSLNIVQEFEDFVLPVSCAWENSKKCGFVACDVPAELFKITALGAIVAEN